MVQLDLGLSEPSLNFIYINFIEIMDSRIIETFKNKRLRNVDLGKITNESLKYLVKHLKEIHMIEYLAFEEGLLWVIIV